MIKTFFDLAALTPSTSEAAAIGEVALIDVGGGPELVLVGGARDTILEIVLDGSRAWRAFDAGEEPDTPRLLLAGTRIQVDPGSMTGDRPAPGDMIATATGWAMRCLVNDRYRSEVAIDAIVSAAELATQRWAQKAYRAWRVVVGDGAAERTIFERDGRAS